MLVGMLPAIELEDQPSLCAEKVNDVVADRRLPPKAASLEPPSAQPKPKLSFSIGGARTQISRSNHVASFVFVDRALHGRPLTLSLSLKGRGNSFIFFRNSHVIGPGAP
jgi:hypothetical protein